MAFGRLQEALAKGFGLTSLQILDTTLRDGSYAVNFSFTANDTAIIAKSLEAAGIEWIEIGHGVGFHGREKGYGQSIQTDEEYIAATAQALTTARWGMFCIPGIAEVDDLNMAADYGMSFVRVGTDVSKVYQSQLFIERAKSLGMTVMANYMKSYTMPPAEFAKQVKLSESYGADVVYIVDSSGGMFPDQLKAYAEAIRAISTIRLGFHGHNNLGQAVSNSLCAAELGITLIDASLQGLGRSSGNAPTEQVVAALLKKGVPLSVDFLKLLELGKQYIQPLIRQSGLEPLDIIAGFSDFHTSYMHHIHRCAAKYQVKPELLIMAICEHSKIEVDPQLLETIAMGLQGDQKPFLAQYNFNRYIGHEQDEPEFDKTTDKTVLPNIP